MKNIFKAVFKKKKSNFENDLLELKYEGYIYTLLFLLCCKELREADDDYLNNYIIAIPQCFDYYKYKENYLSRLRKMDVIRLRPQIFLRYEKYFTTLEKLIVRTECPEIKEPTLINLNIKSQLLLSL